MRVLKVAKVLRLSKILKFSQERAAELEELMLTSSTASTLKLFQLALMAFAVSHYMACLWAGIARAAEAGDTAWWRAYRDGADDDATANAPADRWRASDQYLVCFYWAMTTMTTVGYGDICPESNAERAFTVVAMVAGGAFYGYIIASIASIVTQVDANANSYYERMDMIHTCARRAAHARVAGASREL